MILPRKLSAVGALWFALLTLLCLCLFSPRAHGNEQEKMDNLCREIGRKLGSVSVDDCLKQGLTFDGTLSEFGRPLAYKFYPPVEGQTPKGRILLMGGIHGDEYSAVSIMFKWLDKLNQHHSGLFHWQVVPLLNPDGLLHNAKAQRQNGRGVDLNRNFPSSDWVRLANDYWQNRTKNDPRRFPGQAPMSEAETKWFVETIQNFKPDVIIAVHAPHELIDYDGPSSGPERLGDLRLNRLGTYPGSLGNYGGVDLNIPVVTIELPYAGIMPGVDEIGDMWIDLVKWLVANVDMDKSGKQPALASEPTQSIENVSEESLDRSPSADKAKKPQDDQAVETDRQLKVSRNNSALVH